MNKQGQFLVFGGTSQSDMIAGWKVNYGDSQEVQKWNGGGASFLSQRRSAGLFLDTQYWVEVMTNSANGISPLSSAHSVHTPYVQPTLVVTAPYPATVGQQYMLDLSANYANGTPLSEQIDHWTVNWGDGSSATQTYNPGYPAGSPTYNDSATTDTIQVTGVDGNGNSIANSPQSVTFVQPADPLTYSSHGPHTIGIGNGVDVGGEEWLPVGDDGGAGMTLTYTSSNPAVMAVVGSKVDSDGNYFVLVQGVSYGQADIIGTDQTGSAGDSGNFWDSPPGVQVSNANSNEIEGATYSAGDMPGFVFNIAYPSVTAVAISFTTAGSTLPASLLDWLNSGSVTIPATTDASNPQTSVTIPFTVPDDGNIAPQRAAVVTLVVSGNLYGVGDQTAVMDVANTDSPVVTLRSVSSTSAGLSDNAVIPLDPQGDNTKLTDIHIDVSHVDGKIVSWTLTWYPNDFTMWGYRKIGAPGTDLGSLPWLGGSIQIGTQFNIASGTDNFTWDGSPPADIYGQCLNGSTNWDTTQVEVGVEVAKPATAKVPAETGEPTGGATGTANGLVISGGGINPAGPPHVFVGRKLGLSESWEGPGNPFTGNNVKVFWQISGVAVAGFTVTGTHNSIVDQTNVGTGNSADIDVGKSTVNFLWVSGDLNGATQSVTCTVTGNRATASLAVPFIVYRPNYQFSLAMTSGFTFTDDPNHLNNPVYGYFGFKKGKDDGAQFSLITANVPAIYQGGAFEWVQVINSAHFQAHYLKETTSPLDLTFGPKMLDITYPYKHVTNDSTGIPTKASDGPGLLYNTLLTNNENVSFDATMFLLWTPPGPAGSSDWVPLQSLNWNIQAAASFTNGNEITSQAATPAVGTKATSKNEVTYPKWDSVAFPHDK